MDLILWKVKKRICKLLARHMPPHQLRRLLLSMAGYSIGRSVFIGEELIIKDELTDRGMVRIGDRVAIADRVTLVVSSNANFSILRTMIRDVHAPIEVGNDAWLGTGCIILPGVRIGRGAVIGAGSVVTRDVANFTIVAGNPAKTLKKITEAGTALEASNTG